MDEIDDEDRPARPKLVQLPTLGQLNMKDQGVVWTLTHLPCSPLLANNSFAEILLTLSMATASVLAAFACPLALAVG